MMPQNDTLLKLLITILLCSIFGGCVKLGPTKPNEPYYGPYPESWQTIEKRNPLLAKEIGKMPEIQDGISDNEAFALEEIVRLYNLAPKNFDQTFGQMYQVGIPEVRKYCSPLQALYWLAENDQLSHGFLDNYELRELLDRAWRLNKPPRLSDEQVLEVVNGVRDKSQKRLFLQYTQNGIDDTTLRTIHTYYKTYPDMFSRKSKKLLRGSRWVDFNQVTDRLNAPELIDYYEKKLFKYKIGAFESKYDSGNLHHVFRYHEGNCSQVTAFTVYCLRKAGYNAKKFHVISPSGKWDYHVTTLSEVEGKKYIMDNADPVKWGIEPYDSYIIQIPPVHN
jgi:hypothetical protein